MDPIAIAAGTALVGAIATDTWQQVKDAVTGLWGRVHPHQGDGVGSELDTLRAKILQARHDGDDETERNLEVTWQLKLRDLLREDPALAAELGRVLDEVLKPALTVDERGRVATIVMTGSSHDRSTFKQIGTQNNYGRP